MIRSISGLFNSSGGGAEGVGFLRSPVAAVPAPRQLEVPVPAMRAEGRAERAELEPAHVQLARYSAVGTKPPMSVPQYGMPDRPVLIAIGTCVFSVSHRDCTSPDHRNAP